MLRKKEKQNFNKTLPFRSWCSNWAWPLLRRWCNRWILSNFGFSCRFDNSSGIVSI